MIAVLVTFAPAEAAWDRRALLSAMEPTVAAYVGRPGVLAKTYWIDEPGRRFGAFYLWETAAAARAHFDEGFADRVADRFGAHPRVELLEVPFHVDNGAPDQAADLRVSPST